MRPPARHAATCWVAAVRRNDQLEDISFCFMGSVHTVVYVRFPFPVLVLSFPKKRPPCRLNHPTEHPAFLFYCRDQLGVTSHGVETPPMEMFRFACIRACGNKWGSAGPCVQLNYRRPRVHRSRFAALARGMTPAGQWTSTSTSAGSCA